jgi:hypothetical protein
LTEKYFFIFLASGVVSANSGKLYPEGVQNKYMESSLLKHGAEMTKNNNNQTPVDIAKTNQSEKIYNLMLKKTDDKQQAQK